MHLMPLWNKGNVIMEGVNQYFERVASTVTAVLRSTVNTTKPANQPVIGTTTVIKTCAAVTWPCLIPPALLSFCTIIFLALTMRQSRRSASDRHWPGMLKSSALGVVLYGPSEGDFDRYDGLEDMIPIEAFAERTKTRLRRRKVGE